MSWTTNQWTASLEQTSWSNSIRSTVMSFRAGQVESISKSSHASAGTSNALYMPSTTCCCLCKRRERIMTKYIKEFIWIGPAMFHSRRITNTSIIWFLFAESINQHIWSSKILQTHKISIRISHEQSRFCLKESRREGHASLKTRFAVKIWQSLEWLNGTKMYRTG